MGVCYQTEMDLKERDLRYQNVLEMVKSDVGPWAERTRQRISESKNNIEKRELLSRLEQWDKLYLKLGSAIASVAVFHSMTIIMDLKDESPPGEPNEPSEDQKAAMEWLMTMAINAAVGDE